MKSVTMVDQRFEKNRDLILQSAFFDEKWYLKKNKDVASAKMDAADHYLRFGAREGRDPSPFFSSKQYYTQFPDLISHNINPLVHFLRYGITDVGGNFSEWGVNLLGAFGFSPEISRRKCGTKALFVTHDLNYGGAPHVLANIVAWFQKHTDYEAYVVSMAGGPLASIFDQVAPMYVVGNSLIVNFSDIDRVKSELKEFVGSEPAFTFINSAAAGGFCDINPYEAPVFGYIHEMPKVLNIFDEHYQKLKNNVDHILLGYTKEMSKVFDIKNCTYRPAFINVSSSNVFLDKFSKKRIRQSLGWDPETNIIMGCGVLDWRKQPDLFVRAAKKLVFDLKRNVRFVWCGGGEELQKLKELASQLGVSDHVEFMGYREDFSSLVEAADVFALCSVEDPFPLVCLQAAAASVPSVVFREATGMTALIEPPEEAPGGIAVTLNDEEAYFTALDQLIVDDVLREEMAAVARDRLLVNYTTQSACREILQVIREHANIKPKVSVVVPSYNCAPYLTERLESISNQTFQDIEIVIVDDNSKDNSQDILQKFALNRPDVKLYLEDANSGSVFKAWSQGIRRTSGEMIWIAEADDYCEDNFLEQIVSHMNVPGVRFVHGRSIPVDSTGNILGDWNDLYLDKIAPGRWHKSFTSPATKEINLSLGRANSIPNASAVVVRRSAALRGIELAEDFKLAGDWAFYVSASVGGMISYCHEAVNYHRRHQNSVTSNVEGTELYFQELANVGKIISTLYGENKNRDNGFDYHIRSEAKRFNYNDPLPEGRISSKYITSKKPGILFGVGDLSGGGAQMFAVRFVNEWQKSGAPTVLFVVGHQEEHSATRSNINPEVPVVSIADIEASGGLSQFMADWGLDVIFTGHWWADRIIGYWKDKEKVPNPWAIIMHGCYEIVVSAPEQFPGYQEDFSRAEKYCDYWIWTAPKNKRIFDEGFINPKKISHVVNGFKPLVPSIQGRQKLNIEDNALVFTLASRAIEEKGWLVSLDAFKIIREKYRNICDVRLQLIGDGPIMDYLQLAVKIEGLHLVRHTARLVDYIYVSDVCLLPSWYVGESLPLAVIEFLAQGKPAIVSDIALCPWAISAGEQNAGYIVERDASGKVDSKKLAEKMSVFIDDRALSKNLEPLARAAFKKFDMDIMIEKYTDIAKIISTKVP